MEAGNIYALRNKPGTTEFLAGASLEIFKKALVECARQKYNSERVDAAVKLLYPCFNKPNEYSLADVWERSVALNVVIRSLDQLGSILTTTANDFRKKLDPIESIKIAESPAKMLAYSSCSQSQMILAPPKQRGFDALVTYPISADAIAHYYLQMKIAESADETKNKTTDAASGPSSARLEDALFKTLLYHIRATAEMKLMKENEKKRKLSGYKKFKLLRHKEKAKTEIDSSVQPADLSASEPYDYGEGLENVYFVAYAWMDVPHGDKRFADQIISGLRAKLHNVTKSLLDASKSGKDDETKHNDLSYISENIDGRGKEIVAEELRSAILKYLDEHGRSHIIFMGKSSLDTWLIPTLRVVPRIVEDVENGKQSIIYC